MITKIILALVGVAAMLYADYVFCNVGFFWANEALWYLGLLVTITYISSAVVSNYN